MDEQKNMPGLKEGQTILMSDEAGWQKRMQTQVIINGKLSPKKFVKKYGNHYRFSSVSSILQNGDRSSEAIRCFIQCDGAHVWEGIDRTPINAIYLLMNGHLQELLFDPSAITDIDFAVYMLSDVKEMCDCIISELASYKAKRGC